MIRVTYNTVDPDTGVINVDVGVPKDAKVQIVRADKTVHRPPQKAWVAGVINTNLQPGDRLEVRP
jgi:hypothetical protein